MPAPRDQSTFSLDLGETFGGDTSQSRESRNFLDSFAGEDPISFRPHGVFIPATDTVELQSPRLADLLRQTDRTSVSGIKIVGERSSGTNFASNVIQRNVDIFLFPNAPGGHDDQAHLTRRSIFNLKRRRAIQEAVRDHQHHLSVPICGGWKHAAATDRLLNEFALVKAVAILFIVRHPVAWSDSMHRNPFHSLAPVPRSYSDFIRAPWICAARDELGERLLQSPLDLYARKFESYRRFVAAHPASAIVRYEDFLEDPAKVLQRCGLGQYLKDKPISLPSQSARTGGRGNLDLARYRDKAASTSYTAL